ncbi:MAG: flavodoxin [Ruminococcus sp.]|nr:flavodoxin [Ruminococcus sp.]
MKKLASFLISGIMSASAVVTSVPFNATMAESAEYTLQDAINLQDFILSRVTGKELNKSFDLNGDGRVDIFDLCLMRREILKKPEKNNDTLVAYFSCTGNTETIAEYIIDMTQADSYIIEAETPYTDEDLTYTNSSCRANKEQNDKSARPEIAKPVESFDNYEVIYLGYPIWWGEEPRIIDTFLESYDFSDKIVIPFCTSGSSGNSTSERNISNLVPIGNQLEGKRFSASASKETVKTWVDEKQSEISDLKKTVKIHNIR